MLVKGWYEPVQEYFVVDFLDDPVFALTSAEADLEETWSMFDYGVCAVTLGNMPGIRYHRLGIPVAKLNAPASEVSIAERLAQAARTLKDMENEWINHSPVPNPDSPTLRQLRLASEMLTVHHQSLVETCMKSYRSAKGTS